MMHFHIYVYIFLFTAGSLRICSDSHSVIKPVMVPVTRIPHYVSK